MSDCYSIKPLFHPATFRILWVFVAILLTSQIAYSQLNRSTETSSDGTEYYLFVPSDYDGSTPYPLIIYLHGAQAIGNDISKSQGKGLPGAFKRNYNNQFDTLQMIVVAPHVKGEVDNDYEWSPSYINEVVEEVLINYNIDNDRIFGSGISLGAKGIWDYALTYPSLLAAIIPISGSAPIDNICTLDQTAVWAFHGEADGLIPISGGSDRYGPLTLVEAINNCSTSPYLPAHLTTLEAKGHGGWDEIYDLSAGYNIYEWMLNIDRGNSNNYTPMVNLGPNLTYAEPGQPLTIRSFAWDPNGSIVSYNWTQTAGSTVSFTNGGPNITITLDPVESITLSTIEDYTFQLEVTDSEGLSKTDEVTISMTDDTTSPVVTELRLFDGLNNIDMGPISNNQQIDTDDYNLRYLNIIAVTDNLNARASVTFAFNEIRNFISQNDNQINSFYSLAGNSDQEWIPSEGNYTIIATAYGDRNRLSQGISIQRNITLTPNPLPVEMIDFRARINKDHSVSLTWKTTSEINNSHFEIFEGSSPDEFKKIGSVKKQTIESDVKSYNYRTTIKPCGTYFYQVRNIDYDGHIDYSPIERTSIDGAYCDLQVIPNPGQPNSLVRIAGNGFDSNTLVSVSTLNGKTISLNYQVISENIVEISTNKLQAGYYILNIKYTYNQQSLPLIISP